MEKETEFDLSNETWNLKKVMNFISHYLISEALKSYFDSAASYLKNS